jgi:DNA-binding MarR family transcriptional regulator
MPTQRTEIISEIFDLARCINSNQLDTTLTMIQLRTVMYISENGTVKPTEIAKNFNITPASVTSQIDTLVKRGLIERVFNQDDKRVIEVTLTKQGKDLLPKEIKKLNESSSWIFKSLTKKDESQLLEILMKINGAKSV